VQRLSWQLARQQHMTRLLLHHQQLMRQVASHPGTYTAKPKTWRLAVKQQAAAPMLQLLARPQLILLLRPLMPGWMCWAAMYQKQTQKLQQLQWRLMVVVTM
jgi:hypothetical protein